MPAFAPPPLSTAQDDDSGSGSDLSDWSSDDGAEGEGLDRAAALHAHQVQSRTRAMSHGGGGMLLDFGLDGRASRPASVALGKAPDGGLPLWRQAILQQVFFFFFFFFFFLGSVSLYPLSAIPGGWVI